MTSASSLYEVGAVVLGYVGTVASWRRPSALNKTRWPMLVITACDSTDEGVHTPAASISINSREGLLALRAAIDEALTEPQSIAEPKAPGEAA
jgi:hypothetical protein